MDRFFKQIAQQLNQDIVDVRSLSGGSISSAYRVRTSGGESLFLKVNREPTALAMFTAEKEGLNEMESAATIAVPKVWQVGIFEERAYIMMEHIESKASNANDDYIKLGQQLAHMHQHRQSRFGFSANNFIGSLPQSNKQHDNWVSFYWHERIAPQLAMAHRKNLLHAKELITEEKGIATINDIVGNEVKPSLLHGDLWGGNYLIHANGTPFLIDPAVYYGHSMVDIAMSKLFGGFVASFYSAYHDVIPKPSNYQQQIELYQLYFLLVHLNLFGASYYGRVKELLDRYF